MPEPPRERRTAANRSPAIRPIAFFDVDETLITAKSMLDFARQAPHSLRDDITAQASGQRHSADADLTAMRRRGASRVEMNRVYYRRYAGVSLARLQEAGRDWYHAYRTRRDGYVRAGLAALARHRRAGHTIVLISGSARPLLTPLAQDLGADRILCTEQFADAQGVLTGEVDRPMIGEAKAEAVTEVMAKRGWCRQTALPTGTTRATSACCRPWGTRSWSARTSCWCATPRRPTGRCCPPTRDPAVHAHGVQARSATTIRRPSVESCRAVAVLPPLFRR